MIKMNYRYKNIGAIGLVLVSNVFNIRIIIHNDFYEKIIFNNTYKNHYF